MNADNDRPGKRLRSGARPALAGALVLLAAAPATATGQTEPLAQTAPEIRLAETGECGEIVLAEFSWATARLSARLLDLALTDGYGCRVERRPADPARAVAAVARSDQAMRQDDGAQGPAPAVIATGAGADAIAAAPGAAKGAAVYGGFERSGWFVPNWFAAAHPEIRRIEDAAARPQAFAVGEGVKPRLFLCPAGWPCHQDDLALVRRLGLQERFEIVTPDSGDALTAALIEAWRSRKPWIGSYWTPSAAVAEHPMVRLETGALEICDAAGQDGDAPQCRAPHSAPARHVVYPEAFAQRAPRAAGLLRRFAIPHELVLDALAWRAATNASIEQTALRMLERRPELWRSWLDAEARERMEPALRARLAQEAQAQEAQAARSRAPEAAAEPAPAPPQTAPAG